MAETARCTVYEAVLYRQARYDDFHRSNLPEHYEVNSVETPRIRGSMPSHNQASIVQELSTDTSWQRAGRNSSNVVNAVRPHGTYESWRHAGRNSSNIVNTVQPHGTYDSGPQGTAHGLQHRPSWEVIPGVRTHRSWEVITDWHCGTEEDGRRQTQRQRHKPHLDRSLCALEESSRRIDDLLENLDSRQRDWQPGTKLLRTDPFEHQQLR